MIDLGAEFEEIEVRADDKVVSATMISVLQGKWGKKDAPSVTYNLFAL